MRVKPIRKPLLARELYRPDPGWTLALLAYAVALLWIPATFARLVAGSGVPAWVWVPTAALCAAASAHGMTMCWWVGHEGLHLALDRHRWVSALLGTVVASLVPGTFVVGYAASHWSHHRYTNERHDPEWAHFSRYRKLWARALVAPLTAQLWYLKDTVLLAAGRRLPYPTDLPFTSSELRLLAAANLLYSFSFALGWGIVAVRDPLAGVVSVGLPLLLATVFAGLRPYLEHARPLGSGTTRARSRTSPLATALSFGNNFHLEHHLYPGIPCYRLPRVHEYLERSGYLAELGARDERSAVRSLGYARSSWPVLGREEDEWSGAGAG